ncbi:MAG: hypothetical protein WDN31_12790 [Hyphomicrobium sp.]
MNLEARLPPQTDRGLLAGYAKTQDGSYDELLDAAGNVRPHWQPFLEALAALPPAEQAERADRLNRRVREMGIAHDIFADPAAPGKTLGSGLRPAHSGARGMACPGKGDPAAHAAE